VCVLPGDYYRYNKVSLSALPIKGILSQGILSLTPIACPAKTTTQSFSFLPWRNKKDDMLTIKVKK
jgi:hypothetical protein